MASENVDIFREIVLSDRVLQEELYGISDRTVFTLRAVEIASTRGVDISAEDVENELRNGRREWIERWI